MNSSTATRCAVVVILCTAAALSGAGPAATGPAQSYQDIYGEDARKVGPKDAGAFALRLVGDAAGLADDRPLADLLLIKAQEFWARVPAGDDKLKVADEIASAWAGMADAWLREDRLDIAAAVLEKAVKFAMTACPKGVGELQAKAKGIKARIDLDKRLADLLVKNKAKPDDAVVARALVQLYVVDLDQPASAEPYLQTGGDEKLRMYVPLAAKPAVELDEQSLKSLAEFYSAEAVNAGPAGKATSYQRVRRYYELFLAKHAKQDAEAVKAQKALAAAEVELGKLTDLGAAMARGEREITLDCGKGQKIRLVLVRPGKFLMGSNAKEKMLREDREGPQHPVAVTKPFYMGIHEVTQAQYEAITGKNPSLFKQADFPVHSVSWVEAQDFCKRLSEQTKKAVRLPTEAEWEYACRGGSASAYPFGDDAAKLSDYAWFKVNSEKKTHPVGQKKPNALGLYDMIGNVKEWCADWYADKYDPAQATDPRGPKSGDTRCVRGSFWGDEPRFCRSARRTYHPAEKGSDHIGLRVAISGAAAE